MKKIVIIGTGVVGSTAAKLFAHQADIEEVILCDANPVKLKQAMAGLDSKKFKPMIIDAQDIDKVASVLKGASVVFHFGFPDFNFNIMKAALKAGVHYVDASLNDEIADILAEERPFPLDEEFKQAGLTALITCGNTPGISNVVARYLCDKLDEVDTIDFYLGFQVPDNDESGLLKPYLPLYSPKLELEDYAGAPLVFINGEFTEQPLFANMHLHPFADSVGEVYVSYHFHDEVATIPHFIGKNLKRCTYNYPARPEVATIVLTGLASQEPINVNGIMIAPIDLVNAVTEKNILADRLKEHSRKNNQDESEINFEFVYEVHVTGKNSAGPTTYIARWANSIWTPTKEKVKENIEKLGSPIPSLQVSALTGARMILEGNAPAGVIAPECLDPNRFFELMKNYGMPMQFAETSNRTINLPE